MQERLAYRAQIFIRDEISSFVPSSSDLDYPNKLLNSQTQSPTSTSAPINPTKRSGTSWYMPLEKTLVCLSKLYRCLDTDVFRYLAQQCISECVTSLVESRFFISKSLKLGKCFHF